MNSEIKTIATGRNSVSVYLDPHHSNVALHLLETPHLLDLVAELIATEDIHGEKVAIEKDMLRTVGHTSLVKTDNSDEIVYAKRKQRDTYSRFVKNKQLLPTSWVTVILFREDNRYFLWSAWCGRLIPRVKDFWKNHALVYDPAIIQTETETNTVPSDDV